MKSFLTKLLIGIVLGSAMAVRAELANGIQAIVNDSVITFQQLKHYIAQSEDLLSAQYRNEPEMYRQKMKELLQNGLEDLIRRQLILRDFKNSGFNVPETIIDEMVQERVKKTGDRVQFDKQLRQDGLTFEAFRQQIRDTFIVEIMSRKYVPEPIISPHRIETYYQENQVKYKIEDEVKMRMIVLNKTSANDDGATRKRAEEITSQLKDGATFAELASVYSDGSTRKDGGQTGWLEVSTVNKALVGEVNQLKPGQHSSVIETPDACYLILLEDRHAAHVKPLSEVRDGIERELKRDETIRLEKRWIGRLKTKTYVQYF